MEFSLTIIRRSGISSELINILTELNCPFDTVEYEYPTEVSAKQAYSHIIIDCAESEIQASGLVGLLEGHPLRTLILFMASPAMKRTFNQMTLHTADDSKSILQCLESSDAPNIPAPSPSESWQSPELHTCATLRGPRFAMGIVKVWVNDKYGQTTIKISNISLSAGSRAEIQYCPFCGDQLREQTYAPKPVFQVQTV